MHNAELTLFGTICNCIVILMPKKMNKHPLPLKPTSSVFSKECLTCLHLFCFFFSLLMQNACHVLHREDVCLLLSVRWSVFIPGGEPVVTFFRRYLSCPPSSPSPLEVKKVIKGSASHMCLFSSPASKKHFSSFLIPLQTLLTSPKLLFK